LVAGVVGSDDVVPQGFPSGLPGPVGWQVQHWFAGRRGEAGGHVDQLAAQGGVTGHVLMTAGEGPGGAQQVMGDHRAAQPSAIGGKKPRRYMSQWAVDQVGEGGFDDGVASVGDIGLGDRC